MGKTGGAGARVEDVDVLGALAEVVEAVRASLRNWGRGRELLQELPPPFRLADGHDEEGDEDEEEGGDAAGDEVDHGVVVHSLLDVFRLRSVL